MQGKDAGFDSAGDGEFVDDDVGGLVEAVDPVDGLVFDELEGGGFVLGLWGMKNGELGREG